MMYTTKPKLVEGHRAEELLRQVKYDWFNMPLWLMDLYEAGNVVFRTDELAINTPEGWRTATKDDWLVRTEGGAVWPVGKDVFDRDYEALS